MLKKILFFIICLNSIFAIAQTKITGTVFDEYLEPFPGAVITTSTEKFTSDYDGLFEITVKQLPTTITVSSIGYSTETVQITEMNEDLNIILKEAYALDQIVMSASRTPERIIESPVSIERVSIKEIKNSSSVNFYENLANLKGIDVLSNSFNIKNVVSNRGFANTENTRFVQIVDGTESTLPFINYSLGNTFGLNELDVKSIEVLPGAASALYGPNALNGILLMTSKNPFDDAGISSYIKYGTTNQENRGNAGFIDVGVRVAHKFSDKFAVKGNITYVEGEEWHALDYRNTTEQGGDIIEGERTDIDYDGLNVYGDEDNTNLIDLAITGNDLGILPATIAPLLYNFYGSEQGVSRIGFNENELIDYETKSLTFDASIHFRPYDNDDLEIILTSKHNLSDNIIHGSNRYSQKDGLTQQYKFELKAENFFFRSYYTQNNANLVDPRLSAFYINNQFKDVGTYYADFLLSLVDTFQTNNALTENDLLNSRTIAETGKATVGSAEFNQLLEESKSIAINDERSGASLKDRSGYFHLDGNYNFRDLIKSGELQFGGSFRRFVLNSDGQIYNDAGESITFDEFGLYTQLQKKLADERLKITLTGRYDKSQNFEGKFSPRASIAYAAGERKDHNFRVSFQTGFRNPTTQDQYASTNLGDRTILGSVEDNLNRESSTYDARSLTGFIETGGQATLTGDDVKNNSYTLASVEAFRNQVRTDVGTGTGIDEAVDNNENLLEKASFDFVKPETVQTIEVGYRGATKLSDNLFEFDVAAYYNIYNDFITQKVYWSPYYGDVDNEDGTNLAAKAVSLSDVRRYIIRTNTSATVTSYGVTAGFVTKIFSDFNLGASYAFADFEDDGVDDEFKTGYNTPKHAVKVSFGNERLFKNFGFNTNVRWQDEFLYESVFIDDVIDARTVIDAQINYTIPSIKSTFKLGGMNLGGKNYTSVPGTGSIGSQYYISWVFNN